MLRRLKEDRNQYYQDLDCRCWHDLKAIARFKDPPQRCSCVSCGNQRRYQGDSISERRAKQEEASM